MAVDKKSDYVGNHGGSYTDLDGQSKQFTYIDHDPKTKVSFKNMEYNKNWEKEWREDLIERILSYHPSLVHEWFEEFVKRGEEGIKWREDMIRDPGVPIMTLRDLATVLENRNGLNPSK